MSNRSGCRRSPPVAKNKPAPSVRIVGGRWRSRRISFADIPGLRPTPNRIRETLFNWLQFEIVGSRCLDLYAGSGALGFEAASRGAERVVHVDNNPCACRLLEENRVRLQASTNQVVRQDVADYLIGPAQPFDIVFLDPPFHQNLIEPTCAILETQGWLSNHATIYLETETDLILTAIPENWEPNRCKTAGEVTYSLFKRIV